MKHITESIIGRKGSGGTNGTNNILMPHACKDVDGNVYDAVKIGNQVWMAENLRTEHFRNGEEIPLSNRYTGFDASRYHPGGSLEQAGYLYNWNTVNDSWDLAPKGWHVPSNEEFEELRDFIKSHPEFLADSNKPYTVGKCLASKDGWRHSSLQNAIGNDPDLNNSIGFNAYPVGFWSDHLGGSGRWTGFWSATRSNSREAYVWRLDSDSSGLNRNTYGLDQGFSVRCVRD